MRSEAGDRGTLGQCSVEGKIFLHRPGPKLKHFSLQLFKTGPPFTGGELGKASLSRFVDPTQRITFKILMDASI